MTTQNRSSKLIRGKATLADVSKGAADELMQLLSFNASVVVEGVAMKAQVRLVELVNLPTA